jgi:hypothetical protein
MGEAPSGLLDQKFSPGLAESSKTSEAASASILAMWRTSDWRLRIGGIAAAIVLFVIAKAVS